MARVIQTAHLRTGSDESRIRFKTEGGAGLDVWDRYLLLDGKKAFHLGNVCQTCSYLFERLDGANSGAGLAETIQALRTGVRSLEEPVVAATGRGLPVDEYLVTLVELPIHLVRPGDRDDYFVREQVALWGTDSFWDLPHNPRVPYYRAGQARVSAGAMLYNFVVPMFPERWLSNEVIAAYRAEAMLPDASPTVVAISLLDVKGPTDADHCQDDPTEHWLWTHFVLDGHHKLAAANRGGHPARLLSFVSLSQGVSTREQVEQAIETVDGCDSPVSWAHSKKAILPVDELAHGNAERHCRRGVGRSACRHARPVLLNFSAD